MKNRVKLLVAFAVTTSMMLGTAQCYASENAQDETENVQLKDKGDKTGFQGYDRTATTTVPNKLDKESDKVEHEMPNAELNEDGSITIQLTDDMKPTVNEDGSLTWPEGVRMPEDAVYDEEAGTVTIPAKFNKDDFNKDDKVVQNEDGSITIIVPEDQRAVLNEDGTIVLPNGSVYNFEDGTLTKTPKDKAHADFENSDMQNDAEHNQETGTVALPNKFKGDSNKIEWEESEVQLNEDGSITIQLTDDMKPTVNEDGSLTWPKGVKVPEDAVYDEEAGTVTLPAKNDKNMATGTPVKNDRNHKNIATGTPDENDDNHFDRFNKDNNVVQNEDGSITIQLTDDMKPTVNEDGSLTWPEGVRMPKDAVYDEEAGTVTLPAKNDKNMATGTPAGNDDNDFNRFNKDNNVVQNEDGSITITIPEDQRPVLNEDKTIVTFADGSTYNFTDGTLTRPKMDKEDKDFNHDQVKGNNDQEKDNNGQAKGNNDQEKDKNGQVKEDKVDKTNINGSNEEKNSEGTAIDVADQNDAGEQAQAANSSNTADTASVFAYASSLLMGAGMFFSKLKRKHN